LCIRCFGTKTHRSHSCTHSSYLCIRCFGTKTHLVISRPGAAYTIWTADVAGVISNAKRTWTQRRASSTRDWLGGAAHIVQGCRDFGIYAAGGKHIHICTRLHKCTPFVCVYTCTLRIAANFDQQCCKFGICAAGGPHSCTYLCVHVWTHTYTSTFGNLRLVLGGLLTLLRDTEAFTWKQCEIGNRTHAHTHARMHAHSCRHDIGADIGATRALMQTLVQLYAPTCTCRHWCNTRTHADIGATIRSYMYLDSIRYACVFKQKFRYFETAFHTCIYTRRNTLKFQARRVHVRAELASTHTWECNKY
jgi:hypothetical protein